MHAVNPDPPPFKYQRLANVGQGNPSSRGNKCRQGTKLVFYYAFAILVCIALLTWLLNQEKSILHRHRKAGEIHSLRPVPFSTPEPLPLEDEVSEGYFAMEFSDFVSRCGCSYLLIEYGLVCGLDSTRPTPVWRKRSVASKCSLLTSSRSCSTTRLMLAELSSASINSPT